MARVCVPQTRLWHFVALWHLAWRGFPAFPSIGAGFLRLHLCHR